MKKVISKNNGLTLIELLITVSLIGLIFGLGMHPMLSQIRLIRAERAEIALFDDANLVANYITRDAMRAEGANDSNENEIKFTITTDHTTPTRITKTVRYYVANGTELRRDDSDEGEIRITNKLSSTILPTFTIDPNINLQNHRLQCSISFQDPDDPRLTTQRSFEVMLRCRDTRRDAF